MKHPIFKPFIICIAVLCSISAVGQNKFAQTPAAPGRLTINKNATQFINSFKVLPGAKASSLANTATAIINVIAKLSRANAPVGYDTEISFSASATGLHKNEPGMDINCSLRNLHKNMNTGEISTSMDGADLYLKINDFDIFSQMGNYWKDCSRLKLPLFFEAPQLTDSTNNFIEFIYKGDPVRIVTTGFKPLLMPLSTKEYLQFLIASREDALKNIAETIKGKKESQQYLEHFLTTEKPGDTANTASTIRDIDNDIAAFQKNQKQTMQEIADCNHLLKTLLPQDAAAPARINYDVKSNGSFGGISQLVPAGRHEGIMLQKLNPGFYNRSSGAPVAQMIVLYYAWPKVGFTQGRDFVQQAVVDIFNNLSYQLLKESMK